MLPKNKRLNLNKDFRWVASGKRIENNYVKLFLKMSSPSGVPSTLRQAQGSGQAIQPKVGISLSKNTFKKAVDRNRARRLVSKAFENMYNELPSGLNIVAMPKEGVLKISSEELTKSLYEILINKPI